MDRIMVGVELLFTGMLIVFLVLLFLMYVMKAISRLFGEETVAEGVRSIPVPSTTELPPEEVVAIMTALGKVLPSNGQAVVKIASPSVGDTEDEAQAVAAIAGALAVAIKTH
ncbi:MAG TPA: hypothetical protein GXZ98_04225 [Firmicutes bacterium]|nr:hypothetical protein [Bacillota bacterium]